MLSLFSTSSDKAGFRLQYMEIYNWGTFDKQIFKIQPTGNNSLLTGGNGSGKTTFIDALLTLIVPSKRDRFYNQSSGIEKKGDRNEESYVLGHYGNIQKEGELSATTQKLRDKGTYSIILACFKNTDYKIITLFQVRWFSNGVLKRSFGIAHKPLEIQKDFNDFDSKGNWKKRLSKIYNSNNTKKIIEYFDGPTNYAERMVQLFGMRSTKALSLFNQVVGIKVLGDLNEFIRTNMLEWRDAENEYIQLKESFITLMDAKNNIDKAKEQISQLKPINEIAIKLTEIEKELSRLQTEKEIAVYWFAFKGKELSKIEKERLEIKLQEIETELEKLKTSETELKREETTLSVQIEKDEVGRQIRDLTTDINRIGRQRDKRKSELEKYNRLAQKIDFSLNPNEDSFIKHRDIAKEKKKTSTKKIEEKNEDLRKTKNIKDEIRLKIDNGIENVKSLQKNKNNIPVRVAEIREEILQQVGATKDEIPFIGELLSVREEEKLWEASIEKVLHNFALRLIIPEQYYQQVNEYVNSTDLKGRIIYQRYKSFTTLKSMQSIKYNDNALINKISFKEKNPYKDWIEDRIINQYNYNCTESLKEFNTFEKAITKEGLVKFGKGKHEKDDRKHIISKENYVLGWDNKEKLDWWRKEIKQLQENEKSINSEIKEIEKSINSINELKDDYSNFFNIYTQYDGIDWHFYAKIIQEKEDQKIELEKTNDKVKALQKQLEKVQDGIKKNESRKDETNKTKYDIEKGIEGVISSIDLHSNLLTKLGNDIPEIIEFEESNKTLLDIEYFNFLSIQELFQNKNKESIEKQKEERNTLSIKVSSEINLFKNPPEEITVKFKSWRSDVNNLSKDIKYISEYQKMFQDLVKDDLPRFETKFNKYLEDTIINKVGGFNMFFQNWSDDINVNIDSLNEALIKIDFKSSPTTFIQLIAQYRPSEDIDEFRKLLHNAIPDFKELGNSVDGKRIHFENHIEPLIKRLEDEKWRTIVLEVRNWYEYKAEEFYRENNQKFNTYSGMGHLSGGEKAQLTFTILGSAIAYQFGLTKDGLQSNSFRFIAIDEAFKAQDEDKARYLITLCKQLHLQLLVVTPSDNIHIVENDISFVHYVERKDETISWLYDMTIEQFKKEREKSIAN